MTPANWGWGQMVRHLKDEHGTDIPMFWSLSDAHLAHLKAHQSATPEETPMLPIPHEHNHGLTDFHADRSATVLAGHLETDHGIDTVGLDHNAMKNAHVFSHQENPQVSDVSTTPETRVKLRDQDPEWSAAQAEDERQHEIDAVYLDRVVCAMTGLDFDRDWAADDGIGPSGRGAMRRVYTEPAKRLMAALSQGDLIGLLDTTVKRWLAERDRALDQLDEAQVKRSEALRGQHEQQRALEEMAGALTRAEAERDEAIDVRDRAQAAMAAKYSEAAQLRDERDEARRMFSHLQAEHSDLGRKFDNVVTQRDNLAVELINAVPSIEGEHRGLSLTVPPGTRRLMLTFVPNDGDAAVTVDTTPSFD
ncbi:MAG TPA: hypothetical protein VF632_25010 [Longimicrobium sp.]